MTSTNEEKERADFEADCKARGLPFLSRSTEPGYTHQYDSPTYQARWEGWKAGRAALRAESEPQCRVCGGNDSDVPCAYTTEKPEGCMRAARLSEPVARVIEGTYGNRIEWLSDEAMMRCKNGDRLYTAPQTLPESKLVEVAERILAKLKHPTEYVNAKDSWELEEALSEHRAQTLPIVEREEP